MARTNKKLSKKALSSAITRHNFALQYTWNYETMQGDGFAYSMIPVFRELYDNEDEICEHLQRHMVFYNCHTTGSVPVFAADVALEEQYQCETGDSLKVALMGPLAGIGDTLIATLIVPAFNIIAASFASEANYILALIFATMPMMTIFFLRWPLFSFTYKKGVDVIADISGSGVVDKLKTAATILGITVVGGFVPSMLSGIRLNDNFLAQELYDETGNLVKTTAGSIQASLDSVLPCMLPILLVVFCYWLLKKKKWTPIKIIGLIAVLGFVFGFFGVI